MVGGYRFIVIPTNAVFNLPVVSLLQNLENDVLNVELEAMTIRW